MKSTHLPQGCFITFEGIDGSGKTTQLERCSKFLLQAGYDILITRNPGGTELGQEIRNMLLHYPDYVSPNCELLLYLADRAQHMEQVIFPGLAEGKIILCDRHMDSTMAYQGYGRGLDLKQIETLNAIATQGKKPDLTFLFDGEPEILQKRVHHRGKADRLEQEALAFHQKVREGYRTLADKEPERIKILNALDTADKIQKVVENYLMDYLQASRFDHSLPLTNSIVE